MEKNFLKIIFFGEIFESDVLRIQRPPLSEADQNPRVQYYANKMHYRHTSVEKSIVHDDLLCV